MNDIKELLLDAPDGQLDKSARDSILTWSDPPRALEILRTLDECAYAALASGFAMNVLGILLDLRMKEESITRAELEKQAVWRERLDR